MACEMFELGKAEVIHHGKDVAVFSDGNMLSLAKDVSDMLGEKGISCAVINLRSIKPFDHQTVSRYASECTLKVTLEDNNVNGGMGAYIFQNVCCDNVIHMGWPDEFIPHGKKSELMERYGLTKENIAKCITDKLNEIRG